MAVITCENLTKKFGDKIALNHVNLQIEENQITGLIGRNGSGKTTFMRLACGILKETSGRIELPQGTPYGNIQVAKNLIYSFHNYPHQENQRLKYLQKQYEALFPEFDNEFATNLLKYYSLEGKMLYKSLSQGMKSMFNFSMALAARCPITFLDEPLLGMDAKTRKHAYEILLTEFSLHPRNFIISSHMLNEFDTILSDIILIDNGELIFHEELENVVHMAYRVDGPEEQLEELARRQEVLYTHKGEVQSYVVIAGQLTEGIKQEMQQMSLECSMLRPEEICIYYSSQKNQEDLSCLWNETN